MNAYLFSYNLIMYLPRLTMHNGIRWNRCDGETNARCRWNAFASHRKQIAGRGRLIKNVNKVSRTKRVRRLCPLLHTWCMRISYALRGLSLNVINVYWAKHFVYRISKAILNYSIIALKVSNFRNPFDVEQAPSRCAGRCSECTEVSLAWVIELSNLHKLFEKIAFMCAIVII